MLSKLSSGEQNPNILIPKLTSLVNTLPFQNRAVLEVLLPFLIKVNSFEQQNKMTIANIAIVFSPTLGCPINVMHALIEHYDDIFNSNLIDL